MFQLIPPFDEKSPKLLATESPKVKLSLASKLELRFERGLSVSEADALSIVPRSLGQPCPLGCPSLWAFTTQIEEKM